MAYLVYRGLVGLWALRPDLPTAVLTVVLLTLLGGYLSYAFGTARLLDSLDAHPVAPERAPGLYRRLDRLSAAMDVSRPEIRVARMRLPNAFALGGAGAGVIVLDTALLHLLTADEVEAILAHELAHLESHDALVQSMAYSAVQTVVSLVSVLLLPVALALSGVARATALLTGGTLGSSASGNPAVWLHRLVGSAVVWVLLAFTVLVRIHSRRREFAADDRAAAVTGNPLALARALRKIERHAEGPWGVLAPLYVRGEAESDLSRMLSTHPETDARIERLVRYARRQRRAEDRDSAGGRSIPIE
jgi:heat shock protein HtpX